MFATLRMVRHLPAKIPFPKSAYAKYIPLRILGYGAHGRVFLCAVRTISPTGDDESSSTGPLTYKLVAIKVVETIGPIHLPEWHYNDEFCAVEMLKMVADGTPDLKPLNVPTIIDIGFARDPTNWTSWYAMEAVSGCTLGEIELLQASGIAIPAWLVAHVLYELINALAWLHKQDLYHGDLHTDNILVSGCGDFEEPCMEPKITLLDFGTSRDIIVAAEQRIDCREIPRLLDSLMVLPDTSCGGRANDQRKERLVADVRQAVNSWRGPMLLIDHIWEECNGHASDIRELGYQLPPAELAALVNRPLMDEGKLEELIKKDGEDFDLV